MPIDEAKQTRKAIEKRNRRNKINEAVSLINKFHSLDQTSLGEDEKIFLRNHVKRELNKMSELPNSFKASIAYWIEDREAWFNR
tara:strand:- start:7209 stop:7460 length:252 start_codon:yes stop_codon:yes gene_type:complete